MTQKYMTNIQKSCIPTTAFLSLWYTKSNTGRSLPGFPIGVVNMWEAVAPLIGWGGGGGSSKFDGGGLSQNMGVAWG